MAVRPRPKGSNRPGGTHCLCLAVEFFYDKRTNGIPFPAILWLWPLALLGWIGKWADDMLMPPCLPRTPFGWKQFKVDLGAATLPLFLLMIPLDKAKFG